jgi:UDP-N-acetyl-D-galactosamine dehydrogenase
VIRGLIKMKLNMNMELKLINDINETSIQFDAIILAVSHDEFKSLNWDRLKNSNTIVYDVKGVLPKDKIDARL